MKKRILTPEQKARAAANTRKWRQKNAEKAYILDTNKQFRKKYGITLDDYEKLHLNQNGLCKLCKKPESITNRPGRKKSRLAVDHNHKTGKIRGLLCFRCNTAIGQIEKENLATLIELYLRENV